MEYTIVDHQSREVRFQGEQLLEFEPRGHEHMGEFHGFGGALYAKRSPGELVAVIDLPGTRRDRPVSVHRHVVIRDQFIDLLDGIDALDVMQHNCMPHWVGSCAMLSADASGKIHIHLALCRAKAEFMAQCRVVLSHRFDLSDLWIF